MPLIVLFIFLNHMTHMSYKLLQKVASKTNFLRLKCLGNDHESADLFADSVT
jgi:hypothetical protein